MQRTSKFTVLLIAILLIASVVGPVAAQGDEWPRTVVDGAGNEVTLDAEPMRIASVTLASDEILLQMVDAERLVGVTSFASDPAISNVATLAQGITPLTADPELLVSLDPDLVVVATWTDAAVVDQLKDAGLTLFLMPSPVGIEAIKEAVTLIGEVVGEEEAATAMVDQIDADLATTAATVEGAEVLSTLYLTPGNYTSGISSTISEVIAAAGGIDVAAEAGVSQFEPLSEEFIIEQDPDVILLAGWTPWDPTFVETFMSNPIYTGLSAVQNERVYLANDAHLTSTSGYIVEGVKDVAAILHPDQYTQYPLTIIDSLGNEVTIESKPQAIVSLTLGTDEMLASMLENAPERIVGLTYLVDTAGVSNLVDTELLASLTETRVDADPEQIISLEPDLVFAASFTDAAVLGQLADAGIPVITVGNFTNVSAMLDNLVWVGDIVGERVATQSMFAELTDRLEAVSGNAMMVEVPQSVVYLSIDNWIAGCNTTLDNMIVLAGGINAACDAGIVDWNQVDTEALLGMDPDVIVFSSWVDVETWLAEEATQALSAVQNEQLVLGNDAYLSAVSQYIVNGVEHMQAILSGGM